MIDYKVTDFASELKDSNVFYNSDFRSNIILSTKDDEQAMTDSIISAKTLAGFLYNKYNNSDSVVEQPYHFLVDVNGDVYILNHIKSEIGSRTLLGALNDDVAIIINSSSISEINDAQKTALIELMSEISLQTCISLNNTFFFKNILNPDSPSSNTIRINLIKSAILMRNDICTLFKAKEDENDYFNIDMEIVRVEKDINSFYHLSQRYNIPASVLKAVNILNTYCSDDKGEEFSYDILPGDYVVLPMLNTKYISPAYINPLKSIKEISRQSE